MQEEEEELGSSWMLIYEYPKMNHKGLSFVGSYLQDPTYGGAKIDEFLSERCGIVGSEKVRLKENTVYLHQKMP